MCPYEFIERRRSVNSSNNNNDSNYSCTQFSLRVLCVLTHKQMDTTTTVCVRVWVCLHLCLCVFVSVRVGKFTVTATMLFTLTLTHMHWVVGVRQTEWQILWNRERALHTHTCMHATHLARASRSKENCINDFIPFFMNDFVLHSSLLKHCERMWIAHRIRSHP